MEREVGREPLRLRGVLAPLPVADDEGGHRRASVVVEHAQADVVGREAVEEDGHVVAEADVLRALPDVEGELRFAPAPVAAVELDDAVLHLQPGEARLERRLVEHRDFEPAVGDLARGDVLCGNGVEAEPARDVGLAACVDGQRVRALGPKLRRHAGLVDDLDEEAAPAGLDERGLCPSPRDLDARLGADLDAEQDAPVEHLLHGRDTARGVHVIGRPFERAPVRGTERLAEVLHGLDQAPHLRDKGLCVRLHGLRRGGRARRAAQRAQPEEKEE